MRSIDTTRTSELSCREHKGWPAPSKELLTTAAESLRRRRTSKYVATRLCVPSTVV